jgi:enoyl-[acyl-carrier protein] reductase I
MDGKLLKGKKGIIFGALNDKSIAWHVALKAWENGAEMVLTNSPVAMRLGTIDQLAKVTGSQIIPADATKMEDIENLLAESMKILGGKFDFILH